MAKCPKCGYHLKPWDVKAECPKCSVNIPNYDWDGRLERDSIKAEEQFYMLYDFLNRFGYSFKGTKLRIARIPISVIPLLSFLLPLGRLKVLLPFIGEKEYTVNIVSVITNVFMKFDLASIPDFAKSEITGQAGMKFMLALVFMLLALLTLVVSFFFLMLNFRHFHSPGLFITNLFGCVFMLLSGRFWSSFISTMLEGTVDAVRGGGVSFGLYISAALFLISAVTNLIVARSKVELPETRVKDINKA